MQLRPSKSKRGLFVDEGESSDDDLIKQDGTVNEKKHMEMVKDLKKRGQFASKKLTKREKAKLKAKVRRKAAAEEEDEEKVITKKEMYQMKKKANQGKAKNKKKYEQAVKQVCV